MDLVSLSLSHTHTHTHTHTLLVGVSWLTDCLLDSRGTYRVDGQIDLTGWEWGGLSWSTEGLTDLVDGLLADGVEVEED